MVNFVTEFDHSDQLSDDEGGSRRRSPSLPAVTEPRDAASCCAAANWFDGIEGAFTHFDGVSLDVLLDSARARVERRRAIRRYRPQEGRPRSVSECRRMPRRDVSNWKLSH